MTPWRPLDILSRNKGGFKGVFIVARDDGKTLDTNLTKGIVMEWLERFGEQEGIKIL